MAGEDPEHPLFCLLDTEQSTMERLMEALQNSEKARENAEKARENAEKALAKAERALAIEKVKRENAERALGAEVERRMTIEEALVVLAERYVLCKSNPKHMISCAAQHRLATLLHDPQVR